MSILFPNIHDQVWHEFANSCHIVTLSDQGSAMDQLQNALAERENPLRLFVPVHDGQGHFRRFAYRLDGEPVTIMGTWFKGPNNELEGIKSALTKATLDQKPSLLDQLYGKIVFLAAACESTDTNSRITGLRVVSDSRTCFALMNLQENRKLGGHKMLQAQVKVGNDFLPVNGAPNTLAEHTRIISLRPSPENMHMFEHAAGLCHNNHG